MLLTAGSMLAPKVATPRSGRSLSGHVNPGAAITEAQEAVLERLDVTGPEGVSAS